MNNNDNILIMMAQINLKVGDLEGNLDIIKRHYFDAQSAGAHIFVTPELALCGYPPEDLIYKEHFIEMNMLYLDRLKEITSETYMILGHIDRDKNSMYNAASVIVNGNIAATARKIKLPNYGVFDEKRYFTPGTEPLVCDIAGLKTGINICEDIWTDDIVVLQKQKGAELIINISASPFDVDKKKNRMASLVLV